MSDFDFEEIEELSMYGKAIREAAIALLQEWYSDNNHVDHRLAEDLRQAIGLTVEELRTTADSDICECHERDGSFVCESCYKKGLRGHMQYGGG